ncbi:DNA polymerase III subunit delta' [Agrococcus sp. HG114]|uniref:DNA polymerase III subunit delta' n=1 Tax=Agrococcus sp. HG114 TaxID=2969757 RepID=UPI00215AB4D0|nr:DNA polymerase III subunit delta' [Agrococcus sp. HG114]MCR8669902.1 DNA polymerase III subunit delta' [Agrococcus sp. HG114]
MGGWDEIVGQADAVAQLRRAAAARPEGDEHGAMTHAWLLTGPPGSGRSNLAYVFAAALLSGPDGIEPEVETLVEARTHPDLVTLSTEGVLITIAQARAVVQRAALAPSTARYRVVVVEDADRMAERTSNALLKALEEPPPETVWVLCAPSEADLLPTIRSRVRTVNLQVPDPDDVARLLVERDGVAPEVASRAAREAQSHIGMARRLATSEEARSRRAETLQIAMRVSTASSAVLAAARFVEIATADADALSAERDEAERAQALRQLGVEPGGTVPPQLRRQLKELEDAQKQRAKRGMRDGVDRILVDLLSLYRDILITQLGVGRELVNEAMRPTVQAAADYLERAAVIEVLDQIRVARERIEANVPPLLALEAMLVSAARAAQRRAARPRA